jgi:hypothetical protein
LDWAYFDLVMNHEPLNWPLLEVSDIRRLMLFDANKFFQWAVVLVGVSDFARPAESLSLTQNIALMATGAIWTRWCLIIKPRNIA